MEATVARAEATTRLATALWLVTLFDLPPAAVALLVDPAGQAGWLAAPLLPLSPARPTLRNRPFPPS